ncbi:MAG: hypothetical protein GWN67_12835 [Phycisphaerae bacterium]|nr:hypothetical protein [Phycisphaerae bacterium]NIU57227.1 hypothetical protein [Phycisphaerae bacterium]NIU99797.1 hypothetical protein [Phycisphaerae bacterium]NIV68814.1 hypothetical protein [Phycisphaerae bacterium]NIW99329.1 hypothetical protein [Phycisphaerae bacterium]
MAAGSIGANELANGWNATTPPFEASDSPFGGWVDILGLIPSCENCMKLKVQYDKWPDSTTPPTSFQSLTDPFKEWILLSSWPFFSLVNREPDSDGWLDILCDTTMGGLYYPWNTAGKNGKYSLRLTIEDTGSSQHVSSPIVLMIDNKRPKASLKLDKVTVCGDIIIGDEVTGKITGTDEHFYSYRLRYESSLISGLILAVRKYTGVSDSGDVNVPFT